MCYTRAASGSKMCKCITQAAILISFIVRSPRGYHWWGDYFCGISYGEVPHKASPACSLVYNPILVKEASVDPIQVEECGRISLVYVVRLEKYLIRYHQKFNSSCTGAERLMHLHFEYPSAYWRRANITAALEISDTARISVPRRRCHLWWKHRLEFCEMSTRAPLKFIWRVSCRE